MFDDVIVHIHIHIHIHILQTALTPDYAGHFFSSDHQMTPPIHTHTHIHTNIHTHIHIHIHMHMHRHIGSVGGRKVECFKLCD